MNEDRDERRGWEKRYREGHTPWDRGEPSPALLGWLRRGCFPAGRILVPGCGYGHEVVALCERGFDVTAVDISPTAIESLQARLRSRGLVAEVICADWFRWRPAAPFDAVYEQTSLCALPPEKWREYASRLADALSPGAILFALFLQTGNPGGPPWHCDPVAMQRLFRPPVWNWLEDRREVVAHPSGLRELPTVILRTGVSTRPAPGT